MKIIGIIPARKNSKEIKNKNIKLLNGKPLISYTIKNALKSNLDYLVVSSDSKKILKLCKQNKIDFILRPSFLAQDSTKMHFVIKHVLNSINEKFDAFMILQPTSPLRNFIHINKAIDLFKKSKKTNSLVSVCEVPHNFTPIKICSMRDKHLIFNKNYQIRQKTHKFFARNGAIYLTKCNVFKKNILVFKTIPFFMNRNESIDIDDMDDWFIAESFLKKQ